MGSIANLLRKCMFLALLLPALQAFSQKTDHTIIPAPVSYEAGKGHFAITNLTQINISPSSKELSKLADLLKGRLRLMISQEESGKTSSRKVNTITLKISDTKEIGKEGYKLTVNKKEITISANTGNGIFYGIQTLFQLLPSDIENRNPVAGVEKWKVPVCKILDYPRFGYRGMHLDVCRHMFPVDFIKKYIDLLSMYKINNFHWHLTEDQGWRLEIKKYPLLTEIGSMRSSSPIGRNSSDDNQPYGGFYTQEEARDIVKYAAERYVNVIPEIELPGHAVAALAAYPELSCTGGPFEVYTKWGVTDDIYCAGKDEVFVFLENVLTEVIGIFPSTYIHIGGDEAPKTRWDACPRCQNRMKSEGLKDSHELQSYFIHRIEKFLSQNGRQIIGWDEILEGGLAPGATVMSWRGTEGGIQAARLAHNVIMTPGRPCYFDHYQGNPAGEPLGFGGYNTLKNVYEYEPIPAVLTPDEARYILGSQGNVWTEYITNSDHVEYMAFPRAIALAEVNWSAKEKRNWDNFVDRFVIHTNRLKERGVNYSKSSFNVSIRTQPDPVTGDLSVVLESEIPGSKILYSLNPTGHNPETKYKGPFKISNSLKVAAILEVNGTKPGNITERNIIVHNAAGKIPVLKTSFSERYAAAGPATLTDGCRAQALALNSDWLGFQGNDADVSIDLGNEIEIQNINIGFLHNPGNWIFLPTDVEITLSTDGINYQPAGGMRPELLTIREPVAIDYSHVRINTFARYIRIVAKNRGICPEGHPGAGEKAWLFMDEIMVNQPTN
ncbi:MAG: family 20 glycosylhydrolase [Bacteroidales bacterium]|nr:family 20 glycosylhydrolase [Bacteroidales bacterium]